MTMTETNPAATAWEITPEHEAAMEGLTAAFQALGEAERAVQAAIERLPVLPNSDSPAPAPDSNQARYGIPDQVVEGGYQRWTDLIFGERGIPGSWLASTDGWDDMSEGGSYEYVEAGGAQWQSPVDLDWD
jgi:hypothetical protein